MVQVFQLNFILYITTLFYSTASVFSIVTNYGPIGSTTFRTQPRLQSGSSFQSAQLAERKRAVLSHLMPEWPADLSEFCLGNPPTATLRKSIGSRVVGRTLEIKSTRLNRDKYFCFTHLCLSLGSISVAPCLRYRRHLA